MALPTITQRPITDIINPGDVYPCLESRWNALHNPVVYEILNDKWPVNNLDAADSITAHADDNGNVQFTIAGHSYNALEWVTIAGSGVTSYNGVWQIIDTAVNTITLDLAYEAGAIGGAITATLYYQNYHSLIQVYAGIPLAHILAAEDPIVLVATIKALPDDNNTSKVDVSSLARDHINLLNELGLIDNDTNLWTAIYIKFAESYDTVSAGEVVQFTSSYTDDSAETVYGVQAKMPFQNEYGGNMGAYVPSECGGGLFLTKFMDPVIWADWYYDLSFIVDPAYTSGLTFVYSEYDINQTLVSSGNTINITDLDEGIYRRQLNTVSFTAGTVYIIGALMWGGSAISANQKIIINSDCENQSIYLTWLNNLGGWDYWNFTAEKEYGIDIEDSSEFDSNVFVDWPTTFINGETVTALEEVKARNTRTVRSQFVTETQVQAIANITTSIRVQEIRADGTKITVLVDKRSFKIWEDNEKLYSIEFTLRYTDLIPVQNA